MPATRKEKQAKHTPGPWEACGQDGCIRIRATDVDGTTVYPAAINGNADDDEYGPTTRANAELIAAAPDLLAACRVALQAIEDAHHGVSTADQEAMIEQVIAEAEGNA